jgi:Leucine rich repeat/Immunoglobulin domain
MLRDFLQIILIVALSLMFRSISGCPSPCMCKWKGGKQTVECGGHKLPSLPEGMDPGSQVLNFSHNALTVLQSERFQKMELINLQKIFLANNELIRINDRAFRGLSNLVELDLSDNSLMTIPTETFQDYSSLMRLSLSGNPIRELKTSAFKYLSYLTTLELSNCQISVIEDEAFIGMDNLEWLKLDGNRIRTIRGGHILPESLNGISLHGNRWACDCKLMDVYGWLTTYPIPQIEDPKCFEPQKLQGHTIKSLLSDELACLPEISPTTIYLEIAEGRNISLLCKITAIPEASISWWFQGQILQNDTIIAPNLHLYYYIEEGGEEKRSELFIFNANADDNGTFQCVAENTGEQSSQFEHKVHRISRFTS